MIRFKIKFFPIILTTWIHFQPSNLVAHLSLYHLKKLTSLWSKMWTCSLLKWLRSTTCKQQLGKPMASCMMNLGLHRLKKLNRILYWLEKKSLKLLIPLQESSWKYLLTSWSRPCLMSWSIWFLKQPLHLHKLKEFRAPKMNLFILVNLKSSLFQSKLRLRNAPLQTAVCVLIQLSI